MVSEPHDSKFSPSSEVSQATAPTNVYVTIYVLLAATFMAILDETVMGVTIPVVKVGLGIGAATAGWLTTLFPLTMAVITPVTDSLISAVPIRTLFAVCQGLFVAGTVVEVLAPNFAVIPLTCTVQTSGIVVLLPLLMTTALNVVPGNERGRMMRRISVVIAAAPAIGPTTSGLILQIANSNQCTLFDTMLPLSLVVLVIGVILVPKIEENFQEHVDVLPVSLSAGAFGPLVYALSRMGMGFSLTDEILNTVGTVLLVLFVLRQRHPAPMGRALLDLRALRTKSFRLSTIILSVGFMLMFDVIIILPLYLSQRGVDIETAGLIITPDPLIMGLMGPVIGQLFDKYDPRPLAIPDAILLSLGLFGLGFISVSTPLGWTATCHIVFGISLGPLLTPLFAFGLDDLSCSSYPDGSTTTNTLQQVANAVGTAPFVTVSVIVASGLAGTGVVRLSSDDVIWGYGTFMFVSAALGVILAFPTAMLKCNRVKTQLYSD